MLKEINRLKAFFEDCYRWISVREYAREIKISPPTASKMLKEFAEEGMLKKKEERGFLFFSVNHESKIMRDLSRIYWQEKLKPLTEYIEETIFSTAIILFGSLSKLECRKESDIDILVFSKSKKNINLNQFEKKFGREIQIFVYESLGKINKELRNNVINAHILKGYIL